MNRPINLRPVGRLRDLFRCGNPSAIDSTSARQLFEVNGIRNFVDLRTPWEIAASVPPQGLIGANIHWIQAPIANHDRSALAVPCPGPEAYCRYYLTMLDEAASAINKTLSVIAALLPTPLLFGCYAGKDRTGLVSALLLELAGAGHDEIIADYALSESYLLDVLGHFEQKRRAKNLSVTDYKHHLRTPGRTIELLYEFLDGGSLVNHLRRRGLTFAVEERLTLLLAPQ